MAQTTQVQMPKQHQVAQGQNEHARRQQLEEYENGRRNSTTMGRSGAATNDLLYSANYGALAWYKKSYRQYGYVFTQGSFSEYGALASVQMMCEQAKIVCNNITVVLNKWVVIGRQRNNLRFAVGEGQSRAAAESAMQTECSKRKTTCVMSDAFEVLPDSRGANFQETLTFIR
jgi:hypothetical protein